MKPLLPIHPRGRELRADGEPNPFESYLLAVGALQGYLVLSGIARPDSLQLALGTNLRIVWASLLLFGGGVTLAGLYWPADLHTGFEVKRVGLFACGAATAIYGVALCFIGPAGYVAAAMQIAFSMACFVRIYQVTRRIRKARAMLVAARNPKG